LIILNLSNPRNLRAFLGYKESAPPGVGLERAGLRDGVSYLLVERFTVFLHRGKQEQGFAV
jgi:hypothetical protein